MKKKVSKERKVSLCRVCGGTGYVKEQSPRPVRRLWKGLRGGSAQSLVECPQCGGSGRVIVSLEGELDLEPYVSPEGVKS